MGRLPNVCPPMEGCCSFLRFHSPLVKARTHLIASEATERDQLRQLLLCQTTILR